MRRTRKWRWTIALLEGVIRTAYRMHRDGSLRVTYGLPSPPPYGGRQGPCVTKPSHARDLPSTRPRCFFISPFPLYPCPRPLIPTLWTVRTRKPRANPPQMPSSAHSVHRKASRSKNSWTVLQHQPWPMRESSRKRCEHSVAMRSNYFSSEEYTLTSTQQSPRYRTVKPARSWANRSNRRCPTGARITFHLPYATTIACSNNCKRISAHNP